MLQQNYRPELRQAPDDDAYRQYCNYEGPEATDKSDMCAACLPDPSTGSYYPCDFGCCPFLDDNDSSFRMYFCRDNCGLGVDKNDEYE